MTNTSQILEFELETSQNITPQSVHITRDLIPAPPRQNNHLKIQLAETPLEHVQAFHLVHEKFNELGYLNTHPNRVHITPWNLQPHAHTFTATRSGKLIGTVTCIEDSAFGLPVDQTYGSQIAELRSRGIRFVEISSFALLDRTQNSSTFLNVLAMVATYSNALLNASAWVCTVNPRHYSFYKRVMLFEKIGEARPCASANGAPAVLLFLDLNSLRARYKKAYENRPGEHNLYQIFFPETLQDRLRALRAAQKRRRAHWPETERYLKGFTGR